MNYKFYIYCVLLLFTAMCGTVLVKVNEYYYSYDQYWLILFYMYLFFIVNILVYLKKHSLKQLTILCKNTALIKKLTIPSLLYTLETVILWFSFVNIPISAYIIGRTSNSFFNVPFTKYYLKKKVPNLYYIGLVALSVSYILLTINFSNFAENRNFATILSLIALFISGISTATYNNIIEKHLSNHDELLESCHLAPQSHTKLEIKLFYQIMINLYGFIIMFPIAVIFCGYDKLFSSAAIPNIIFLIAGFSSQIYFLFKILILGYKEIAGNHVISAIDLFRRVLTNIIAFMIFGEYFNTQIIIANLCMLTGSILFMLGQFDYKFNLKWSKYSKLEEEPIMLESILDIEIDSEEIN